METGADGRSSNAAPQPRCSHPNISPRKEGLITMRRSTSRIGFTLIELLIVVAIIAILAAIAVPNFLEAQVRAKVSRARSDMRTLATGMESYAIDNNSKYPPEHLFAPELVSIAGMNGEMARNLKCESYLTTPVSYLTSIPSDVFGTRTVWEPHLYWYYNWKERMGYPPNPHADAAFYYIKPTVTSSANGYRGKCPWFNAPVAWILTSLGPDGLAQFPVIYDSTNGTISGGDLTRVGPGGQGS